MSARMIALWVLSFLVGTAVAEVFSSYAHVEQMIDPAGPIAETLERFVRAKEQRLKEMKNAFEVMKSHMVAAWADREAQLNNPINVYFLMKTFAADWSALKPLVSSCGGEDVVAEMESTTPLPDNADVDGAAVSLFRLQDTYDLNATQISSGMLSEAYRSPEFTARDCLDLGIIAHSHSDYYHAVMWMHEATSRWEKEADTRKSVDRVDIVGYLCHTAYVVRGCRVFMHSLTCPSVLQQGNSVRALALARQMLDIDPEHPTGRQNWIHLQQVVEEEHPEALQGGRIVVGDVGNDRPDATDAAERDVYEGLCRGDGVMNDPARVSKLSCYYLTRNNPRLLLSPAKVEEAFDRPLLLLFHDILLESEMELVKTLARPKLTRATTLKGDTFETEKSKLRISKHAWLFDSEHTRLSIINQRFGDLTGLDVTTAEAIQVANYGLGGYYIPHFDYFGEDAMKTSEKEPGDRIATLLLYMTDVSAGGATVFPNAGARIVPRKGTAVFWHNLHRSGTCNTDTLHAACPVLLGNKWAVNKWFREHGQELRRPCSLDPSE